MEVYRINPKRASVPPLGNHPTLDQKHLKNLSVLNYADHLLVIIPQMIQHDG